jgi:hypothetical protein
MSFWEFSNLMNTILQYDFSFLQNLFLKSFHIIMKPNIVFPFFFLAVLGFELSAVGNQKPQSDKVAVA